MRRGEAGVVGAFSPLREGFVTTRKSYKLTHVTRVDIPTLILTYASLAKILAKKTVATNISDFKSASYLDRFRGAIP